LTVSIPLVGHPVQNVSADGICERRDISEELSLRVVCSQRQLRFVFERPPLGSFAFDESIDVGVFDGAKLFFDHT